jgi:hypothetical protein
MSRETVSFIKDRFCPGKNWKFFSRLCDVFGSVILSSTIYSFLQEDPEISKTHKEKQEHEKATEGWSRIIMCRRVLSGGV